MPLQEVEIINKLGLHARASSKLTQLASQFQCEVWVSRNQRRVNAKSIMGLITLGVLCNTTIKISATGADETAAVEALVKLIDNRFEE